jgi:hypothetical protein
MAAKRRYNAQEAHKLILENSDCSDSDNGSEVEHDSASSDVDEQNQNAPDNEDEIDSSSDDDDEGNSTVMYQQGSGVASSDRGQSRSGWRGTAGARGGAGRGAGLGQGAGQGGAAGNFADQSTPLTSKNGDIFWMTQPVLQVTGRHATQNVMHINPGPTRFATRNVDSPMSAFELFMRGPILDEIEKWTNSEGKNVFADNWKDIVRDEMFCYLGVLILIGVYRSKNEPISELWNQERGRPIISGSMARDRFQQISRVLRFDDASGRRQRHTTDKLAPIRTVFDMWEATLEDSYVPFENVTVDEQLLTYRGRCPFIQYIPSKPGKYGIKFWMLSDSKTSYVSRVQVYTGRQPGVARETNQGQRVVQELCRNLAGSGRNVTCDNFFTSLSLIQKLKKDKMTLLGTVRKNRAELPPELVTGKGREVMSTLFAYHKDATVASYCPKKGKVVTLMSSLHSQGEVDATNPKKKPEMILEYNATKGGVDTADKMLRTYSTKRMTRRWPVAVFSNMLDISALDAYIVWILLNPEWKENRSHKRRLFLHKLGKELAGTQKETAPAEDSQPEMVADEPQKKRGRCSLCPRADDKKTPIHCAKCGKGACKKHAKTLCIECFE